MGAIALGVGINNCVLRTFILGYNMGMMTLSAQGMGKGGEAAKMVPEYMNRTMFSGICLMVIMDGIMLFLQQVFVWIQIEPESLNEMILYSRITLIGFYF